MLQYVCEIILAYMHACYKLKYFILGIMTYTPPAINIRSANVTQNILQVTAVSYEIQHFNS
jgi:hypothetical protein